MQNEKITTESILLGISRELMTAAGLREGMLLQMTAEAGKLVIERLEDTSNYVCDGDCDNCPINATECEGDCAVCPCKNNCEQSEV